MALFLTILFFVCTLVSAVMMIFVLRRVIRFGENVPERTHKTFILSVAAGGISVLSATIKTIMSQGYIESVLSLVASAFCLLFAVFFKRIVSFFEDEFDKRHQIPVKSDDGNYRFIDNSENNSDFFDENSRFNGDFTDFDNR